MPPRPGALWPRSAPFWGRALGRSWRGPGDTVPAGPGVGRGPWEPHGSLLGMQHAFPRGSRARGRGPRARVLFGGGAVRIPSARPLSRRPLGQGNKAPFSSPERRPASCVQLCAPWEPPRSWPLRLPGDEGPPPPPALTDSPCGAPSLRQAPPPPRPPCCVTFGSDQPPLGCHLL